MKVPPAKGLTVAATLALACIAAPCLHAQVLGQTVLRQASPSEQTKAPVITLDPPTGSELQAQNFDAKGNPLRPAPANFRRLGQATMDEAAEVHTLTLRFAADTTLTGISSTTDFPIQGGTCASGNAYKRGTACTVVVRFIPQGPGNRLGHLTVTHSGSATPDSIGLGGYGYAPVLSFVPSVIQTVPGTYVSGAGLLNGAQNLATDGGDRLFIADTNNVHLLMIDSTGTIDRYSGNYVLPPPLGIAVDNVGGVWFTVTSNSQMYEMPTPTLAQTWGFSYTDNCTYLTAKCNLAGETLYTPAELSADSQSNIFFSESFGGAAMSDTQPAPTFLRLGSNYAYHSQRFAADSNDNLYSFDNSTCRIMAQTLYDAQHLNAIYRAVAGSAVCGFSGDGGDARNAQIGTILGQFAFDAAGNLYFTDESNHRVRRIDYNTGTIRTIAGNGIAGYTGDGGLATAARLSNPTGLAVDSQGQVYIISADGSPTSATQVIRKLTVQGELSFGNQVRNTSSAPHIVTVSNTGNANMVLNAFSIVGANPGDFAVDPVTTSCDLTHGATLSQGATCTIGVIFTPPGVGARSAKLIFADNTVTNSNTVLLYGTGALPAATLNITSPTPSQSFAAGAPVPLAALVVATGPAPPTGTIQFQADGSNYGSPVTLVSGAASINVTGLSPSSPNHTLGAIYSGDSNYGPAGPVTVSIKVAAGVILSRVSLAPVLAPNGASVSGFAVSVASDDGIIPTGQVQLKDGTRLIAVGALSNGHTLLQSPPLSAGVHSLTAVYAGDIRHSSAVSPVVLEVINSAGQCSTSTRTPQPLSQP